MWALPSWEFPDKPGAWAHDCIQTPCTALSNRVFPLSLWTGEALGKQDPNAPFFLRGRGEREGDRMRMGEGRDATNWDEQGYRSSILQERETQSRTVFRTVFAPSPNPNPDVLVVASSDGSLAPYSISSCISSSQVSLLLPFLLNPDPPICRPRPPHSLALDSGQRNWNLGGAHRQWVLQTHGLCATCSTWAQLAKCGNHCVVIV